MASRPLLYLRFKKLPDGTWLAMLTVPGRHEAPKSHAAVTTTARGHTKAAALTRAGALADSIMNDPIVSAIIPPQAKVAVAVARNLGRLAQEGMPAVEHAMTSIAGEGKKRLLSALSSINPF